MHALFMVLALIAGIGGLVCWVIIMIDAFNDAIWKGLLFLICGLYGLYYMLFEFEHDEKWLLVLGAIGGGAIATGLSRLG